MPDISLMPSFPSVPVALAFYGTGCPLGKHGYGPAALPAEKYSLCWKSSVCGCPGIGAGQLARMLRPAFTVKHRRFCLAAHRDGVPSAADYFRHLFDDFGRRLGGYLWMLLFIVLWTLLLIVPGIVKAVSYSMTPYLLATQPGVSPRGALKLSMRMTRGHGWEIFWFLLSFYGWLLLCALPLAAMEHCIRFPFTLPGYAGYALGILYVYPYRNLSLAGLYEEIRQDALRRGAVTPAELDGSQPVA